MKKLIRHCEPTGPARSGRPDDKLREAIQVRSRKRGGSLDCFVASLLAMTIGLLSAAAFAGLRPSRQEIIAALNLRPGAHVPLVVSGRRYEARYVRLEARGGGEYALIFRLSK